MQRLVNGEERSMRVQGVSVDGTHDASVDLMKSVFSLLYLHQPWKKKKPVKQKMALLSLAQQAPIPSLSVSVCPSLAHALSSSTLSVIPRGSHRPKLQTMPRHVRVMGGNTSHLWCGANMGSTSQWQPRRPWIGTWNARHCI